MISYRGFIAVLTLVLTAGAANAADMTVHSPTAAKLDLIESLEREAAAAVDRGLRWLAARRQEDGHWSDPGFPALTGLPLWAFAVSGREYDDVVDRAVQYILSCRREDGGIYVVPEEKRKGGGLGNYNTAVCIVALHKTGRPEVVDAVLAGRKYLAESQHLGGDMYYGGMGYDASTGRAYADLSNSYIAYEAMRLTEDVEDLRKDGERVDLDWKAAKEFLRKVHNDADFNDQPWAATDPRDKGGFVYHPEQTRAGTRTMPDGSVKFRSMSGMTYAGLLSYIYADVERTDPRVEATVNWIVNNWSLSTNSPVTQAEDRERKGVKATDDEQEGLFYLYNVMSKGLNVFGQDVFYPPEREAFNWRVELIKRLLSLQRFDDEGNGYWVNPVSRYWEGDPVLVTSYALIAMQYALEAE